MLVRHGLLSIGVNKTGTLADLGCFSFQNSKHFPAGEGGAIIGNDGDLIDRCHACTTVEGLMGI